MDGIKNMDVVDIGLTGLGTYCKVPDGVMEVFKASFDGSINGVSTVGPGGKPFSDCVVDYSMGMLGGHVGGSIGDNYVKHIGEVTGANFVIYSGISLVADHLNKTTEGSIKEAINTEKDKPSTE